MKQCISEDILAISVGNFKWKYIVNSGPLFYFFILIIAFLFYFYCDPHFSPSKKCAESFKPHKVKEEAIVTGCSVM